MPRVHISSYPPRYSVLHPDPISGVRSRPRSPGGSGNNRRSQSCVSIGRHPSSHGCPRTASMRPQSFLSIDICPGQLIFIRFSYPALCLLGFLRSNGPTLSNGCVSIERLRGELCLKCPGTHADRANAFRIFQHSNPLFHEQDSTSIEMSFQEVPVPCPATHLDRARSVATHLSSNRRSHAGSCISIEVCSGGRRDSYAFP